MGGDQERTSLGSRRVSDTSHDVRSGCTTGMNLGLSARRGSGIWVLRCTHETSGHQTRCEYGLICTPVIAGCSRYF